MCKRFLLILVLVASVVVLSGCRDRVPVGTVGRVNTSSGWTDEILKPGLHSCYGWDRMYLLDTTTKSFKETMNILVGGKVNLKLDFTVRIRVNTEDSEMMKKAFESITAKKGTFGAYLISVEDMYITFLQMKALAVPRQIYEVQPDVKTAVANSPQLALEVRRMITEMAKSTPLSVEDAQITNYDWPETITKAQEELVKVQLAEATAEAQVRADLKKAEGDLKVAEAEKLVEMKRAEAVAESIKIIRDELADAPEYLLWHQIRVMGQAAMGPNNCFILYPFATDASQVRQMLGNANLTQMLHPDGPKPELKNNPAPIKKIE